ncbi:MAG: GNAT family N-acetyltransferase [Bacteroidota bacterium]
MQVRYLTYGNIDKQKWDACITAASNGLIYGYSLYLDTMASAWDALVLGDYEAVLPLTWRKKYGIYYLYQPFATAALGVFGNNLNAETLQAFLLAVPAKFRYWDIYLNHGNCFPVAGFPLVKRTNYVLNLNAPYEQLNAGFRENIRRNIRKAKQLNCVFRKDIDVDEVLMLSRQQAAGYTKIPGADYDQFKKLYGFLREKDQATTYGVFLPNGQLVASCVLFFSHNRMFYVLVGNHPNGKTIGASHALINEFISDYADRDILLDFEGSEVQNLAFFYSSFGAVIEKYVGLKLNRIPKILRWIKK